MKKILLVCICLSVLTVCVGCAEKGAQSVPKVEKAALNPVVFSEDYGSWSTALTPEKLGLKDISATKLSQEYRYALIKVEDSGTEKYLYLILQAQDNVPDSKLSIADTLYADSEQPPKALLDKVTP